MKTKKVSPSGVDCRMYAAMLTKFKRRFAFLSLLFCMLMLSSNAWAGGVSPHTYMAVKTSATARGLVYMDYNTSYSKTNPPSSDPALSQYYQYYPVAATMGPEPKDVAKDAYMDTGGHTSAEYRTYFWAKAARGWRFDSWSGYPTARASSNYGSGTVNDATIQASWTGSRDLIQATNGGGDYTTYQITANFASLTEYTITYLPPVGGSYTASYSYLLTRQREGNTEYELYQTGEEHHLISSGEEEQVSSYETDEITLTVPSEATNFIGWFEDDSEDPIETKKSFKYTAHGNVAIRAEFKEIGWGDVKGDLAVNVTAAGTYAEKKIAIGCPTLVGTWSDDNFEVSPMNSSNEYGSIVVNNIHLDDDSLRITYTYTATGFGGISVDVTVTPTYGEPKQFTIAANAEEVVDYEACIEEGGVRTYTGTLAQMMTQANSMNNKPTLKLMQNKTITAPLSFTNSFTFDVNGRTLTANCASAFSIDAAEVDVQIIDGSFTQVGEIHTSHASTGVVSVVAFTEKAKLTMQGGTLSAENTGTGSAYGVNVSNGSIFYMTNGQLTVAGVSEARGVNVASANDYATFNGGSLTVSAPANAYGLWSAGSSNITSATISVETTTGANAYGVYVDGGVSTLGSNTIMATAKTTHAYGAYVNAGRLNDNGGSFAASAVNSDVYGVHVVHGAKAMLQMKAVVTAEATGVSGTNVFGINNSGKINLTNISVTVTSPTTNATAVYTTTVADSTIIEGGTYRANTIGGTTHALYHQSGVLNVDGGTFRAIGSGNDIYAALVTDDATIANATLHGETQGEGSMAYAFKGTGTGKNIALTGCIIEGISNTSKAYAIYSNANVTATGCTLTATAKGASEAYGIYAENGINMINTCNAAVYANAVKAYGVYHKAGALTIAGGEFDVEVNQDKISSAQNSELYGVYQYASGVTTSVTGGAAFNVRALNDVASQNVYGAYIQGTLNSTGSNYSAQAKLNVYGVWGNTASTLTLENNTISTRSTNGTKSYGIYPKKYFTINGDIISAVGTTTDVYAMFVDANTSEGDVLSGKFSAQGNGTNGYGALNAAGTVGKVKLKGGIYKTTVNLEKYAYTGYQIYHLDETHLDYADGYRYTIATDNPSQYVCHIVNGAYYATLEAAMQYTLDNSGNYTIVMTQPYTLPAGDYTLPSNATLVVPYKLGQTSITTQTPSNSGEPDTRLTAGVVENFLCLTIAEGAHLNVNGKLGVGAEMFCQQTGKSSYINGPYGRIHMEDGSLIQLNSGSYLYAWGMITGSGSNNSGRIIVKNNAEVHEMFQVGDMKSASNIFNYYHNNPEKYFLITQYSIQNIEVPTTYYYNSRLIGAMLCYYTGGGGVYYGEKNVKLVGTNDALFEVTSNDESSWVRKTYKNSQQIWDINSSAQLGSIEMDISVSGVGSGSFNSANYILPITYNMKMHVLDGDFAITHNTELLPGSSIEIDKTASLTINSNQKLYVFDQYQWTSTTRASAAINVHGNINISGALYTTRSIAGGTNTTYGANIYSNNEDAGTVFFDNAAPSAQSSISLITDISNNAKVLKTVTMDPVMLKNGTGASQAFTPTSGTAANHSFAYMDNEWTETYTDGCFEIKGEHTYAKPGDYVELKKQREQETVGYDDMFILDNHTYLSIDESRIFIHLPDADGGCQWWEVEETTDPTVFECKKTGYEGFYYYDNSDPDPDEWTWKLKTVKVKFYAAEEGDAVLKTIVTDFNGVPDQAVIASNPTKETTAAATYQFYGWQSSVSGTTYPWTATLEKATTDMSYRPVFTATPRNYTVTFINANNGANVPVETAYNTHPVCTPAPTKAATAQYTYYFQNWEGYEPDAELPVVTGATSYTAVWAQTVNKYSIIWKNGDEVLETDTKQPYGTATAFNGTLPTKETDDNFVYAFSGWRSSLTGQTYANGSTPTVAGETTYEAQYTTTPRYKVTFANYDGSELYHEFVTQGEHPVYNGLTPGRARDLDGYFKFIGWKNSDGTDFAPNATLPVVTGKETYTAQYDYVTELYWITLHNVTGKNDLTDAYDNWSGKFGVESTPYYDPNNDDVADMPTKADGMEDGLMYVYTFSGWSPELQPVSGEAEYTALFEKEVKKYTITFKNIDGNIETQEEFEVAYGTTPEDLATLVMPEKADNYYTYAFDSWTPALETVTDDAVYTASFQEGVARTFPITFDPDNGVDAPYVMNVAYDDTPTPAVPATWQDAANIYTFSGWTPAIHAVDGPAEYTAQYTPTIRSYTITFKNYDGTTLDTYTLTYGATPSYSGTPERPVDLENLKKYTFTGWSPAITSVSADAVYTATYSEQSFIATVTPNGGSPAYKSSWSEIFANGSITANCTVKLYADITNPTNNQSISQNMTLDLNGHTISFSASQNGSTQLLNVNNVALTIEDSHGGGVISYRNTRTGTNSQAYVIYVQNNGSVTINGGTLKAERTSGNYASAVVYLRNSGSTLNLNGGELIATENSGGLGYAVYHYNTNQGNSNISGGKLKAKSGIFYNQNKSRITLSGGYYSMNPGNESGNNQNITVASGYKKISIDPNANDGYSYRVSPLRNIIFQNPDGTPLQSTPQYAEGETPVYSGATPTYADGQYMYTFRAWKAEGDETEYTTSFPVVAGNTTYVAQYDVVEEFDVTDNTTVENDAAVTTTTVHVNGILNITDGNNLTTDDFILESNTSASGQLVGAPRLTVNGHAYFDVKFNGETGTANRTWYAIAVPWEVDAENGILWKEGNRKLVLGRDFDLVWYDGAERAANGDGFACWKYVEYETDKMMHPGKMYMMYFGSQFKTVRFEKNDGAPVVYTSDPNAVTSVATYETQTGDTKDGNWNGIANPSTYYASLGTGASFAQILGNGNLDDASASPENIYTTIDLSASKYIVGQPLFVQAVNPQSIVVNKETSAGIVTSGAPRRAKANNLPAGIEARYAVHIALDGHAASDNLFVQVAEEDKADEYVIGQDLAKGGVAKSIPQLWINRYDAKLSVNTQSLTGNTADYPLSLYAPKAGEYTIHSTPYTSDSDYDLYLTQNGRAIWNLSNSAYTLALPQGTTTGYGLRIGAKSPEVATGVDEAVVDAQGETRKVLINEKVFIIRGNNIYSVDGQLVK